MIFQPESLTIEEINAKVENFLDKHHSLFSLAIPIEDIIDIGLGINIVPLPGIKNDFGKAGLDVDAFIMSDFKDIMIDKYTYQYRDNRYRFSLAHELGHMILHENLYKKAKIKSKEKWKKFIIEMASSILDTVEEQADSFAGLILVPRKILKENFEKATSEMESLTQISLQDNSYFIIKESVDRFLAPTFKVSTGTMFKSLKRDGLI